MGGEQAGKRERGWGSEGIAGASIAYHGLNKILMALILPHSSHCESFCLIFDWGRLTIDQNIERDWGIWEHVILPQPPSTSFPGILTGPKG